MKASESRPAPSLRVRLLYWFGIYFAAQLPLIPWGCQLDWRLWLLFPMAMEWGLIGLVSWTIPRSFFDAGGNEQAAQILQESVWWMATILPWAAYGGHLLCTICVRKRRSFLILLWILIGLVTLNIASCAYFFHEPPE